MGGGEPVRTFPIETLLNSGSKLLIIIVIEEILPKVLGK
jgi:hypothetical protein